jgi:ABC-type nickel/cobalt efflux system permease component RcnA
MKVFKNISFFVAVYVTTVGLVFTVLPVTQTALIEFKAPGKYFLMGFAFIFFVCGCWYVYRSLRGNLKPEGVSVVEIRKEALQKIESETYLAKAAQSDPNPEIREKALERLKEITE